MPNTYSLDTASVVKGASGFFSMLLIAIPTMIVDAAVFVVFSGFIVAANSIIAEFATRVLRKKGEIEKAESIYPKNTFVYAAGKLIIYAALMASSIYVDTFIGNYIPVFDTFRVGLIAREIKLTHDLASVGFGFDYSWIVSIILDRLKSKNHPRNDL